MTTAGAPAGPTSDPTLSLVETELAMLTRTLEGMSRRSTLYRDLDRAELRAGAHARDRGAGEHQRPRRARRARRHDGDPSDRDDGDRGARAPQAATRRIDACSLVELTALGRRRMDAVRHAREGRASRELVGDWSDDDRATFGRLLGRLNEAIRAHPYVAELLQDPRYASGGDGGVRDADAALGVGAVARELLGEVERERCELRVVARRRRGAGSARPTRPRTRCRRGRARRATSWCRGRWRRPARRAR